MIKEAVGFGATIDEAKENAILNLGASDYDDIQFDIISMPKKKILGLFGGAKAEVKAFIEVPDKKPQKLKKEKTQPKKEKANNKPVNKEEKKAQPKTEEKVGVHLGLIKHSPHRVYGYFSGKVILDNGEEVTIEHILGVTSRVENLW